MVDHIEQDSPYYAARFTQSVFNAARSLQDLPERGRKVPELDPSDYRQLLIGANYRLIYRVDTRTVRIARLLHVKQNFPDAWKSDSDPA